MFEICTNHPKKFLDFFSKSNMVKLVPQYPPHMDNVCKLFTFTYSPEPLVQFQPILVQSILG